jgi:hypothetical protein
MPQQITRKEGGTDGEHLEITVSCRKVLHVDEVRRLRHELSKAITALVDNFEHRTMCPVMEIRRHDLDLGLVSSESAWQIEVRLK